MHLSVGKSFLLILIACVFTLILQQKVSKLYQRAYAIPDRAVASPTKSWFYDVGFKLLSNNNSEEDQYINESYEVEEEGQNDGSLEIQETLKYINESFEVHLKSDYIVTGKKKIDYAKILGCRKLPDILIIGYEKCGTVTLKSYMGIHPQIYIANPLANYKLFDKESKTGVQTYTKRKPCTPRGKFRLEKLSTRGTVEKTFRVVPDIKLIAIMKEPVERSMSHFVHRKAIGIEKKSYTFDSMIASIMDHNRPFTLKASVLFRQSRYIDRLEPWIAAYGIDKIHVVDGDNFVKSPAEELQKVEKFLGLKPHVSDEHFVYNPVKKFYCLKTHGNEACMSSSKGRPHPVMSNVTRARLQQYYKPYNEKLFMTIGRNFSWNY